ncbi:B-4DMT family transporter [Haloechinothrix alba]|uniref:B-4DMT family transporter n=1 Tax=Haloechinothrix alba TaxID=664784 RepID=UPI00159527A0|nr:B-4DMT family transporter [Haloechinothrix alba]
MPGWLLRALVLAAVHAAASVSLAKVAVFRPTDTTVLTSVTFAVLIGIAAGWAAVDGWLRRPGRGRTWLVAAVLTAVLAGFLDVAGRALLVDQTGVSALGDALTSGAAFVALLVLLPAGLGLFVGGRLTPPDGAGTRSADTAGDTRAHTGTDTGAEGAGSAGPAGSARAQPKDGPSG